MSSTSADGACQGLGISWEASSTINIGRRAIIFVVLESVSRDEHFGTSRT